MNSILTKCFSCCAREGEITNSVFNIKENRKISNSFSNIYSKIKSKSSNSVTNLKKTNFKDESNQKKYSFINSVLLSEEDITPKHKIKTENSFSIKKKSTKKKVTYKDDIINEKNSLRKKSTTKRNSYLKSKNKNDIPFMTKTSLISINDSSNSLDDFFEYSNNSFLTKQTKQILSDSNIENNNNIIYENKISIINNINNNLNESIDENEIDLIPKLIIYDLKGDLFKGKIIKIDGKGCLNGLRRKRDMKTFFGVNDKEIINDITLNINDENLKGKQIFLIYYDNKRTHYYLTNLIKESKLIHIKIDYEYIISKKEKDKILYFSFGKIISSILIKENDDIKIIIYDKNIIQKEYIFHKENSPISIGREKCIIIINNQSISRIHSTLIYNNEKEKWFLNDGNGKGKHSTHGTWIILNHDFELRSFNDKYEIKLFSYSFNISFLNQ